MIITCRSWDGSFRLWQLTGESDRIPITDGLGDPGAFRLPPRPASRAPKLKRVLGLWDLVYYGVILTSPIAVVPMFGEAQVLSRGHAVVTLLAAMVAMTATAVSFGRMATVYPSAGSVYTYVSRAFNPQIGFVLGWAMFLEYLFQPLQNSLYAALTIQRLLPHIPFALLSALAVGFMTLLCWFGIRTTARANEILLAFMSIVMIGFLGEAIWYIFAHQHWQGFVSTLPLYDPRTFSVRAIAAGTALAATTYIGFDGVSILAEEVENPKRNVLLASVLVCVFTGLFAAFQVFLAVRVWPDYRTLVNPETAFMDVARVVGGYKLFLGFGVVLLVSSLACGLAGLLGAVRLLYGMGRDNVLPRKIFGHLNAERGNPTYNVAIAGALAYLGTLTMQWERAVESHEFRRPDGIHGGESGCGPAFWVYSRDAGKTESTVRRDCPEPGISVLPGDFSGIAGIDAGCGRDLVWRWGRFTWF